MLVWGQKQKKKCLNGSLDSLLLWRRKGICIVVCFVLFSCLSCTQLYKESMYKKVKKKKL